MPYISSLNGLPWKTSADEVQFEFKLRCPFCGHSGLWTPTRTQLQNNADDINVYRDAQTNAINGVEIWIRLTCPNCSQLVGIHMAIHKTGRTIFAKYNTDFPSQWWVDTSDESGSTEITGEYLDSIDSEIDRYITFTVDVVME